MKNLGKIPSARIILLASTLLLLSPQAGRCFFSPETRIGKELKEAYVQQAHAAPSCWDCTEYWSPGEETCEGAREKAQRYADALATLQAPLDRCEAIR